MKTVMTVGRTEVGGDAPPWFLPDIDLFFNQDMTVARATIERLITADVTTIKGAVLHRAEIALDDDTLARYYGGDQGMIGERYRELIERKVMSLEATEALFDQVKAAGCDFVLSIYDSEGAAFSRDIGAAAVKIPSSNITHQPLIDFAARLGLPLIVDTGKSDLTEICRAVGWARAAGADRLILEHSPLPPPAPLDEHNLRMIPTLGSLFDCPVGLSDHHHGEEMLYAAVALGASVLEKGICADDAPIDQDVYHAMPVGQVAEVLGKCRAIHEALGRSMRQLPKDRPIPNDRMGLVARHDLAPGDELSLDSVDFAFPAKGIPTEYWQIVCGTRLSKAVRQRDVIRWCDLEALAS